MAAIFGDGASTMKKSGLPADQGCRHDAMRRFSTTVISPMGDAQRVRAAAVTDRRQGALPPDPAGLTAAPPPLTLNYMVKYQAAALDRTFAALADPTRRALLARLGDEPSLSVSELARPFPVSLPAIMKHLDVLKDAGLVTRTKTGRTVSCRLVAAPMEQAAQWLNRYQRFWSERLDRLAALLEEDSWSPRPPPPPASLASPSSGASKHRRRRSSRPGPIRRK